jgi:hypothetical protein
VNETGGSWNVGLTSVELLNEGTLLDEAFLEDATIISNGYFPGENNAPDNAFYNPYRSAKDRTFKNKQGVDIDKSWCFFGKLVLTGKQSAGFGLLVDDSLGGEE